MSQPMPDSKSLTGGATAAGAAASGAAASASSCSSLGPPVVAQVSLSARLFFTLLCVPNLLFVKW